MAVPRRPGKFVECANPECEVIFYCENSEPKRYHDRACALRDRPPREAFQRRFRMFLAQPEVASYAEDVQRAWIRVFGHY